MHKNNSDSILSIIKTIKPYSKLNTKYNKYFVSFNFNIVNYFKAIDNISKKKLHNKELKFKYLADKEIQKTINRLEKMNYSKYLPRALLNKMKIYNNFEEIKKNNIINRIKRLKKISQLDDKYYNEITLDPGRYDPKYNLVYKRTQNIRIGRPKTTLKKYNLEKSSDNNNESNNIKLTKGIKKKNKYKKLKIKNNEMNIGKNKDNIILSNDMKIREPFRTKYNNNFNIKNNIIMNKHFSIYNKKIQLNRTLSPPNIKTKSSISLYINNNNKNNIIEHKNKKIFSARNQNYNYNFDFGNNINEEENINKEMNRCSSSTGFNKGIITFDKIPGRKSNIFNIKEETKNIYYPNYEVIRPHMYVKQFTVKTNLNNYKRYAVGKIIRNYGFSPKDYFIFDINSKKESDIDNNFLSNINRKYNI